MKRNRNPELDFVADLFEATDKLRGDFKSSEYQHIVLGLIFLKYVSEAFDVLHRQLQKKDSKLAEDPDAYLAENVFWVPEEARWSALQDNAKRSEIQLPDGKKVDIGGLIDFTIDSIENAPSNKPLKDVFPKNYRRSTLDKAMLGDLIDLFSNIPIPNGSARSIWGGVYEYFLSSFASSDGKLGGGFLTPRPVVRTLIEMLEPLGGCVYDPCCGSGSMLAQSKKFVKDHGGKRDAISIYGQEINHAAWRVAKMNLAIQGIDADIRWNDKGSFHRDELPDLRADFIFASPPFNISDWGGDRLQEDERWIFGKPPTDNANFAWLQHIYHHLSPHGMAGVVLANGSMSSQQAEEESIRKSMVEANAIDAMVALPGQLFYSAQIPACLWIMAKNKNADRHHDRRDKILFIDARNLGYMVDRVRRELQNKDIEKIVRTYHAWRGEKTSVAYADEPGFCKSVTKDEISKNNFILTPDGYVGVKAIKDDVKRLLLALLMLRDLDDAPLTPAKEQELMARMKKRLELLGLEVPK